MNDIEKRIEELTNELNYHNHKYYVDDAPEISDFAFDKMLVELEQLEEKLLLILLKKKCSFVLKRCRTSFLFFRRIL